MSTCVNTIKWLFGALIITFIFTYVISLNMENHFYIYDSEWLSNDFLFAISGGAFASLLIVLICEIIKYRQLKFTAENALLKNLATLYGQFLIIKNDCKRALNSQEIVADKLIQSNYAAMYVENINEIDYTPLCSNKIVKILNQFKKDKYLAFRSVFADFVFFRIAIVKDGNVEFDTPNVNKVLNKIISQTSTILIYLDNIISQIDNELKNGYKWQQMGISLNSDIETFVPQDLADYLKKDIIVF